MIEAPNSPDTDTDTVFLPKRLRGTEDVKTMRTPGMGARLGSPRPRNLASMGKITPGVSPYETEKPKKMAKGGGVSSASSRADGCALRGKTKGMML